MPVKNNNISFKSTVDQLSNLLKKIKDLTSIDNRVVLRLDKDNILLFSFVGENFKNIHAFKNYIFKIEDIFNIKKLEIEEPIIFMIRDGKRFYRVIENLLDYKEDVHGKININEDNIVNFVSFDNEKLDLKVIGGDPLSISKEISIEDVNYLMDIKNSLFNFKLNRNDFLKIKKMGLIENELKSVLYLIINNNKLSIGETKWHLNITDVQQDNLTLSFPKSYFNTINPTDDIDVYVFENFILCKYDDYNLMIILETSI